MSDANKTPPRDAGVARLARIDASAYALTDDLTSRVMTPALVLYEQQIKRNIAKMLTYMGGDPARWRPHLKTTKTPEIYACLLDAGLRSFKCATPREAHCMLTTAQQRGMHSIDLLLAFPFQGPALQRVSQIAAQFSDAQISVLSESPPHAEQIPDNLTVFVDVNPGMNRTGIPLTDFARIKSVAASAGSHFRGLHFYDGHIHDATAAQRCTATHALYAQLLDIRSNLEQADIHCSELITSGTPAFRYALDYPGFNQGNVAASPARPCVHRVSPGTVVLHDLNSDALLEDVELEPAALLLTRVVSRPNADTVTCDAGSKSLAAEAGAPVAFVLGRPDLQAQTPSEEHLPLRISNPATTPNYGDLLLLVPKHVCPTVNLAEQAIWIAEDGKASTVDITARAHELYYEA